MHSLVQIRENVPIVIYILFKAFFSILSSIKVILLLSMLKIANAYFSITKFELLLQISSTFNGWTGSDVLDLPMLWSTLKWEI